MNSNIEGAILDFKIAAICLHYFRLLFDFLTI